MRLQEALYLAHEKLVRELQQELDTYKEQDALLAQENKTKSNELNEVRMLLERVQYDSKEDKIMLDATREQNTDLSTEIEELRRSLNELKVSQKGLSQEGKEKKKAEKMAALMGNFDNVCPIDCLSRLNTETLCTGRSI